MPTSKEREDFELEDSGGEDDGHEDHEIVEGGKGSSSSQVRKAQNRIAQREFRLRKQIRDLEARVEVLSGDKEERIELMTLLVRNLLKENKDLRGMVKNMAGFIGEGLGSCLPRLGLSADGLDAILNRSDTDTAYEAFVNLKASKEQLAAHPGLKYGETRRRASTMKRKRDEENPTTDKGKGRATSEVRTGVTVGATTKTSGSGTTTPLHSIGTSEPALPAAFYTFNQPEDENYHYLFPDLDTLLAGNENDSTVFGRPQTQPRQIPQNEDIERSISGGSGNVPFADGRQHGYAHNIMPAGLGGGGSPKEESNVLLGTSSSSSGPSSGPLSGHGTGYNFGFGSGTDTSPSTIDGGFGLTLPNSSSVGGSISNPSPSEMVGRSAENPISSLAGPRPILSGIGSQGNYARGHPSLMSTDLANTTSAGRVQTLKEAVGAITNQENPLEGPGVTAAELAERRRQQDQLMRMIEEGDPADRKMETMQLITYHLNNFRMNHEYHLPPSLRPTVVQRTIPHEHAIDGIIFPSIRDRMILLRGRYDLVEVFRTMMTEFELHGEDVLDHHNYEISERFIENYSILIDDSVINISNKWRAQRGAPLLMLPERETASRPGAGHRIHADH
ncbi:hypothetical protein I302_101994 [Kwoniella bestiolae CBS 10118]|uniref:BZIP domain-containing protein n=1 Tax=Kwoniella bestiolae CBS 10118 TaxID=1296100 RepID=A0AAJ8M6B5_9TREE